MYAVIYMSYINKADLKIFCLPSSDWLKRIAPHPEQIIAVYEDLFFFLPFF